MVFPETLKVTICWKTGKNDNFMLLRCRNTDMLNNFETFKNEVVSRFPKLAQFEEIRFFWIDSEQDEIRIMSQTDFFDYTYSCKTNNQKLRIFIAAENSLEPPVSATLLEECFEPGQETTTPTSPSAPVDYPEHPYITCDVCDSSIRGHRYKCIQCFDYDLCMKCEAKFRHKDHVMIRIPKPDFKINPLFVDVLRTHVDSGVHPGEDDYENSKRSKRHQQRHGRDREECREGKERKERAQRRERSARYAEERRNAHPPRRTVGQFKQLVRQIIQETTNPSHIDATLYMAAAASEAAAKCAQDAVHATMGSCPLFASSSKTTTTTSNGNAATATTTSTTTATSTNVTLEPEQPSAPSSASEEPQGTEAAATPTQASAEKAFDFSWFAPTPENLQKINQTFSKLLDPLGMNIDIRSNDSSPKPAQTQTPTEEKKDKTTETPNTPTISTPSQTVPAGTNKSTEMDPITELEKKLEQVLDDMDSSSISSVSECSMLSDNEDHDYGVNKSTTKKWTLVDAIDDQDEPMNTPVTVTEVSQQATVEPVASTSSSQAAATPATPASIPEPASVSSAKIVEQKAIDFDQLGKALKQHLEAELKAVDTSKLSVASETPEEAPKQTTPPAVPVNEPAAQPPYMYSMRPHVNRAVHTMIAMGFSNEGGWLQHLLESVNGDIPRALDHLTPHKSNP